MSNRWAALLAGMFLILGGYAVAGDEEGCLFCHRLELHRSSAIAKGSNLRVWDPPGGLHDSLYCSDCHQDAKVAPHPSLPGPATCIGECHGSETKEVELGLLTYEDVMKGSQYGTVIEAGDPDNSLLLEMVVAGEMPQEADPLPEEEIEILRSWIAAGAENN